MSVRCPECHTAILNTARIIVKLEKRRVQNIPVKVCRHCLIMMISKQAKINDWKIWNGESYVDYTE